MARQVQDTVILSGASQSGIIDCGSEYTLTAITIPSTWTTADITFLGAVHTGFTSPAPSGVSPQDALEALLTFRQVVDSTGTELKVTVGATGDKIIVLPDYLLEGLQFIKIRSGTLSAPVTQAADRTLRVVVAE